MKTVPTITAHPEEQGFTFIELLVVIAVTALLAIMLLPAMADTRSKGGRTQCAANLRQITMASMMYANDYNSWLPLTKAGANPINQINGFYYTLYAWSGNPFTPVPPSFTNAPLGQFSGAGYLYPAGYIGDGRALFCPSQWGTAWGENMYQPLLRSDLNGIVRSSYNYSPQVKQLRVDNFRRYQKTSQLEPRRLFAADILDATSTAALAHAREAGWNVAFSDGSVKFSQSATAHNLRPLILQFSPYYSGLEDQLFEALESDH